MITTTTVSSTARPTSVAQWTGCSLARSTNSGSGPKAPSVRVPVGPTQWRRHSRVSMRYTRESRTARMCSRSRSNSSSTVTTGRTSAVSVGADSSHSTTPKTWEWLLRITIPNSLAARTIAITIREGISSFRSTVSRLTSALPTATWRSSSVRHQCPSHSVSMTALRTTNPALSTMALAATVAAPQCLQLTTQLCSWGSVLTGSARASAKLSGS